MAKISGKFLSSPKSSGTLLGRLPLNLLAKFWEGLNQTLA